jgi:hypothetical protein
MWLSGLLAAAGRARHAPCTRRGASAWRRSRLAACCQIASGGNDSVVDSWRVIFAGDGLALHRCGVGQGSRRASSASRPLHAKSGRSILWAPARAG